MIRGIVRSVSAQGQVVFEQTDPPTPGTVVTHHYEPPTVEGEILGGDEVVLSLRKVPSVPPSESITELAQALRKVGDRSDAQGGQHSATRTMAALGYELAGRILAGEHV